MGRWLWVGLALLAAGSAFGRDVTRRVEMLFPGRYRLTLKNNQMGSVQVLDDRSRGRGAPGGPGDSAELAKADDGSATTWQMASRPGPARHRGPLRPGAGPDRRDPEGPLQRRPAGRGAPGAGDMLVGAYDDMLVVDGRSYFIIGPVTLVEDTGDQDVLIAIGR